MIFFFNKTLYCHSTKNNSQTKATVASQAESYTQLSPTSTKQSTISCVLLVSAWLVLICWSVYYKDTPILTYFSVFDFVIFIFWIQWLLHTMGGSISPSLNPHPRCEQDLNSGLWYDAKRLHCLGYPLLSLIYDTIFIPQFTFTSGY
jgi:hypothetical protein